MPSKPPPRFLSVLAVAGFAAAALFFLREPVIYGSSFLTVRGLNEQLAVVKPQKALYSSRLRSGHLPGWEPSILAGYPAAGDPEYGWHDPFNLPFAAFGYDGASKLLAFFQLFLLALFPYLYLRESGCMRAASWLGGFCYMSGSFVVANIHLPAVIQSSLWLPFLLWMYERKRRLCKPWPYTGLMAIGVALTVLGGNPPLIIVALAAYGLYVAGRIAVPGAWECLEPASYRMLWFAVSLLLGLLLAAPQLLPTMELMAHSRRIGLSSVKVREAFSIGWTPLLLAAWAARYRVKDRRAAMLLCVVTASLAFALVLPRWRGAAYYPLFGALALLAGFGLDDLYRDVSAPRRRFALLLALAALLMVAFKRPALGWILQGLHISPLSHVDFMKTVQNACFTIAAISLIVIMTRWRRRRWLPAAGLIALAFVGAAFFAGSWLQFMEKGYRPEPGPVAEWLDDNGDGARALRLDDFGRGGLPDNMSYFDIVDEASAALFIPDRLDSYWRLTKLGAGKDAMGVLDSPLLDGASIKYVFSRKGLPENSGEAGWNMVFHDEEGRIWLYENGEALSGAWVAPSAVFAKDEKDAARLISAGDFNPAQRVVIEADGTGFIDGGAGEARVRRPSPDEMEIRAASPRGGWLVVSETYFPGWGAEMGGAPMNLYHANVAFMAIHLPPGDHSVKLRYHSKGQMAGFIIAAVALYGLIAGIIWSKRINQA